MVMMDNIEEVLSILEECGSQQKSILLLLNGTVYWTLHS